MAKATCIKFGTVIYKVSTNSKLKFIPKRGMPRVVTYINFCTPLISSKPLTSDTWNMVHTLTTTCPNLMWVWLAEKPRDTPYHMKLS